MTKRIKKLNLLLDENGIGIKRVANLYNEQELLAEMADKIDELTEVINNLLDNKRV